MLQINANRSDFMARLMARLVGKGFGSTLAETVSAAATEAIWKEFEGHRVYFLKGRKVKASPDQVWEEFTGRNHEALARKYGYSMRRVEQIVAAKTAALHSEKS